MPARDFSVTLCVFSVVLCVTAGYFNHYKKFSKEVKSY